MIENAILGHLLNDPNYVKKVAPYLKPEYFKDPGQRRLFEFAHQYISDFQAAPTREALTIMMTETKMDEVAFEACNEALAEISYDELTDPKWLYQETEKWARDAAIYNAVMRSIGILDGEKGEKLDKNAIPGLLSDALGVSFDSHIGHSYFDDAESQWEYYNADDTRHPFTVEILNKITRGGVPKKTLLCVFGGINCFVAGEMFDVYLDGARCQMDIKYIYEKWDDLRGRLYVKTPSGELTPVLNAVKKEDKRCVKVRFENGVERRVAATHRFMGLDGQSVFADRATEVRTAQGSIKVESVEPYGQHDVFDIMIEAPHWYVDQHGIIHHNTGKTTFLVQQAADWLVQGKNVIYFTLEVAENVIRERVDVSIMDMTFDQLHALEKTQYLNRVRKLRAKTQGEFVVKEFPSGSAHAGHFRHVLNELKLKKGGFVPDLIIVDYLSICASSKLKPDAKGNTNTYFTSVAEELRALAFEYDVPLWTGCQFDRSGQTSQDVDMTNTGLALGIQATADFSLAFMCPDGMAKENKAIGKVLKSRLNNKSKIGKFLIGLDNDRQRYFDLAEEEQDAVMDDDEREELRKASKPRIDSGPNMAGWKFGEE